LGLFCLFVGVIVLGLTRSQRGRRMLCVLVMGCAPLLFFAAVIFEGGALERYLPMYPFVFLACALALAGKHSLSWLRYPALLFVLVMAGTNLAVMRTTRLEQVQEASAARIRELQPRLTRGSLVIVVHHQDALMEFFHDSPFHPINRKGTLNIYIALEPGADRILTWRQGFARKVLACWEGGGEVWFSKRFLAPRPQTEWDWVEGDDRRFSWSDLSPFFSQLETGEGVGGEDGFYLLARSPRNEQFLRAYMP